MSFLLPFFNVHVNNIEDCIPKGIPVLTCKYADDCTLHELVSKDSVSQMQDAVTHLESWAVQNKMELNGTAEKPLIGYLFRGYFYYPLTCPQRLNNAWKITKFSLL